MGEEFIRKAGPMYRQLRRRAIELAKEPSLFDGCAPTTVIVALAAPLADASPPAVRSRILAFDVPESGAIRFYSGSRAVAEVAGAVADTLRRDARRFGKAIPAEVANVTPFGVEIRCHTRPADGSHHQ